MHGIDEKVDEKVDEQVDVPRSAKEKMNLWRQRNIVERVFRVLLLTACHFDICAATFLPLQARLSILTPDSAT